MVLTVSLHSLHLISTMSSSAASLLMETLFFFSFTVFLLVEERWSLSQADCLKEVSVSRC